MAITLADTARNAAANAVCALVNGGTIEILTAADAVLATLTFSATAFANAAAGVATANAITGGTAVAGTATKYRAKSSGGTVQFSGTVSNTGGSGDIKFASNVWAGGETISITSLTYTQPAT